MSDDKPPAFVLSSAYMFVAFANASLYFAVLSCCFASAWSFCFEFKRNPLSGSKVTFRGIALSFFDDRPVLCDNSASDSSWLTDVWERSDWDSQTLLIHNKRRNRRPRPRPRPWLTMRMLLTVLIWSCRRSTSRSSLTGLRCSSLTGLRNLTGLTTTIIGLLARNLSLLSQMLVPCRHLWIVIPYVVVYSFGSATNVSLHVVVVEVFIRKSSRQYHRISRSLCSSRHHMLYCFIVSWVWWRRHGCCLATILESRCLKALLRRGHYSSKITKFDADRPDSSLHFKDLPLCQDYTLSFKQQYRRICHGEKDLPVYFRQRFDHDFVVILPPTKMRPMWGLSTKSTRKTTKLPIQQARPNRPFKQNQRQ